MKQKQNNVSSRAIIKIHKYCVLSLNNQGITLQEAFILPAGEIKDLLISGRTLRKVFQRDRVHLNTIRRLMDCLGIEWVLNNGKIDIKDETEETKEV